MVAFSRLLQSPWVNAALTAYGVTGAAFMCFWCIPYNFVVKQHLLRLLSKSALFRVLYKTTPLCFGLLAGTLITEMYRLKKWEKRELSDEDNEGSEGEKMLGASSVQYALGSLSRIYKAIGGLLLTLFVRRAYSLLRGNVNALIALEASKLEGEMLRFKPPSPSVLRLATAPYRAAFSPVFLDKENIPKDRPLLFVSNHTMMAFDFPLLLSHLWEKEGIFLRALADHSHFQIPGNAEVLRSVMGAVDGTPRNVDLLMGDSQALLVYPGGAREVFKRTTDEKYELIWGDRLGFARLALKHKCVIVPVINYGSEDMMSVIADLPMGWLPVPFLWGSSRTFPIVQPNELQRIYFAFGKPIRLDGDEFASHSALDQDQQLVLIRDRTKAAIEAGIDRLAEYARNDKHRLRLKGGSKALGRWLSAGMGGRRSSSSHDTLRATAAEAEEQDELGVTGARLPSHL